MDQEKGDTPLAAAAANTQGASCNQVDDRVGNRDLCLNDACVHGNRLDPFHETVNENPQKLSTANVVGEADTLSETMAESPLQQTTIQQDPEDKLGWGPDREQEPGVLVLNASKAKNSATQEQHSKDGHANLENHDTSLDDTNFMASKSINSIENVQLQDWMEHEAHAEVGSAGLWSTNDGKQAKQQLPQGLPQPIAAGSKTKMQDPTLEFFSPHHHGLHRMSPEKKAKLQVAITDSSAFTIHSTHQHYAASQMTPKKGLCRHNIPQGCSQTVLILPEATDEEKEEEKCDAPVDRESMPEVENQQSAVLLFQNQTNPVPLERPTSQGNSNRAVGSIELHLPSWMSSTSGLVEARTVTDVASGEVLQEAQQVSVDEVAISEEHKATFRRKELLCQRLGCCLIAGALIILAIFLSVFGFVIREPFIVTVGPTLSPSMEPSLVDITASPSGYLEILLADLPNHTRKSLYNISSPQWKAFDWLSHHTLISSMPEWRKKQLFALATFYYAFDGERWPELIKNNWMDDNEECYWFSSRFGTFLSGSYQEDWQTSPFPFIVQQLLDRPDPCNHNSEFQGLYLFNLELSNLAPSMPPEIAQLTSLSALDLPWNNISTPITDMLPSELYEMMNLKSLNFGFNSITGMLPSELGLMTNLMELLLLENDLSGEVPNELRRMTSLTKLFLTGNSLYGTLPIEQLHNMTNMTHLALAANVFSGPVSSELSQMRNMKVLWLGYNSLTGVLPTELGLMTGLTDLDISGNLLSGPLPSELGRLSNMTALWLWINALTGLLPTELSLLTNLTALYIGWNSLSGQLPSGLGSMTDLKVLVINNNALTGTICSEIGEMTSLVELMLSDNSFSGTIPSELWQLKNLSGLGLSNLKLVKGLIPSELSLLTSLLWLDLRGSIGLSGTIPSELCHLRSPLCTVTEYSGGVYPCKLAFDCNDILCGCDCQCSNVTPSNNVINDTNTLALSFRRNVSE